MKQIVFIMILAVICMLFGLFVFDNGFHSMDIGHNMRYLDAVLDINLIDISLQGDTSDSIEAYNLGAWQMRLGFLIFGVGTFMFGVSLADMMRIKNA